MKVVVTGANGFIGAPLCVALVDRGHEVTALVRRASSAHRLPRQVSVVEWDYRKDGEWQKAVSAANAVVHLAGAPVAAKRWSAQYKNDLRSSRIDSTRAIVEAMSKAATPGRVLASGSAVGFYGDTGAQTVTETSSSGTDFLAHLAVAWEAEAHRAESFGTRVVCLRSGHVLDADGGALEKMLPPFMAGVGGPLGSGLQYMSWIHRADEVGLIVMAVEDARVRGPLNLTAPRPVSMNEFAATLGRVLRRPSCFRVPAFVLRAVVGEFAEALLGGQKVLPQAATGLGYQFLYPKLEDALRQILTRSGE